MSDQYPEPHWTVVVREWLEGTLSNEWISARASVLAQALEEHGRHAAEVEQWRKAWKSHDERVTELEQVARDAREHLSRMYGIASGNIRGFPNNWTLQALECLGRIDVALKGKKEQGT